MAEPTPLTLGYAGPGVMSARRNAAALHLRTWAVLVLLFALIVGAIVFDARVVHRSWSPYAPTTTPRVWRRHIVVTYQWRQLKWVAAAMAGPLFVAMAYWFLGRRIKLDRNRSITAAALVLSILHTLGATLLVLTSLLVGVTSLAMTKMSLFAAIEMIGAFMAVAMVPGMLYVSVLLMDLLSERPLPPRPAAPFPESPPPA